MSVIEANDNPFKWKQFSDEIILWEVRWYFKFALMYRDLASDYWLHSDEHFVTENRI